MLEEAGVSNKQLLPKKQKKKQTKNNAWEMYYILGAFLWIAILFLLTAYVINMLDNKVNEISNKIKEIKEQLKKQE